MPYWLTYIESIIIELFKLSAVHFFIWMNMFVPDQEQGYFHFPDTFLTNKMSCKVSFYLQPNNTAWGFP